MPALLTAFRSRWVLISSTAEAEVTGINMAAATTPVSSTALPRTNASKQDNLHP
jgi:hypothetical protein